MHAASSDHFNSPLCTSTLRATTIEMFNRSLYRSATSLSLLRLVEEVKYILYLDMYPNLAIEVLQFLTDTDVFPILVGNLTLGAVRSRGFVCFEIISIVTCAFAKYERSGWARMSQQPAHLGLLPRLRLRCHAVLPAPYVCSMI